MAQLRNIFHNIPATQSSSGVEAAAFGAAASAADKVELLIFVFYSPILRAYLATYNLRKLQEDSC